MSIASPDIRNYTVGKGSVFIRVTGETNFRHIGNCPTFEFTPTIEKLEHFSSMAGVRTKDRTEVLSKTGTLNIVMEEITIENLRLALLSSAISDESGGDKSIPIFDSNAVRCEVKFVGNNDIGPKYEWYFGVVDILPSDAIPVISEEWMQISIEGECSVISGSDSFGTVQQVSEGT
jgi:hypothetical protein